MSRLRCQAHHFREIDKPVPVPLATLGYRDFYDNADWRRNLISTTSLLYHPARRRVVCGLTSFETDLMYEFDPADSQWHSLNYTAVSERFEIKIHRSLALGADGSVWGATAGLHREDQRAEAPGGRIFRYDFATGQYDFYGRPTPPDYLQTITLDESRGLIYGVSYPVFRFFAFDIRSRQTRFDQYVGSCPHIMALDDDGCVWSTWSARTHHLCKYDPEANRMVYFQHGLPNSRAAAGVMFPGAGPIDMMLNGGDGFLYVGMPTGDLARISPPDGRTEYLGRPSPSLRMAALEVGPDGLLYGIAGWEGQCVLFAYDRQCGRFDVRGHVHDEATGLPLFIAHDMCFTADGRLFIGETDTADRAGYLWECFDWNA